MLNSRVQDLTPNDLDGAFSSVVERIPDREFGRVGIDGTDAGKRNIGSRVKERVCGKVKGTLKQYSVDGKVHQTLTTQGRRQGEKNGR